MKLNCNQAKSLSPLGELLFILHCVTEEQAASDLMGNQPTEEEMQRICSIIIVDLNSKEIHLKVS